MLCICTAFSISIVRTHHNIIGYTSCTNAMASIAKYGTLASVYNKCTMVSGVYETQHKDKRVTRGR